MTSSTHCLLIKKCTGNRWYKDKIGDKIPYLGFVKPPSEYKTIDDDGHLALVLPEDADVVSGEHR